MSFDIIQIAREASKYVYWDETIKDIYRPVFRNKKYIIVNGPHFYILLKEKLDTDFFNTCEIVDKDKDFIALFERMYDTY